MSTDVVFVAAHGVYPASIGTTIVSEGQRVFFYAEHGNVGLGPNALAALTTGGSVGSRDSYSAGDLDKPIPNYFLGPHDDAQVAQYIAARSSLTDRRKNSEAHGALYFIGADLSPEKEGIGSLKTVYKDFLPLCTTPIVCGASGSKHDQGCMGLFAQLAIVAPQAAEIHLLCCRAIARQENPVSTVALGEEKARGYDKDYKRTSRSDFFDAEDNRYMPTLINKRDELIARFSVDVQSAAVEFEDMPQATRAAMASADMRMGTAWDKAQMKQWPLFKAEASYLPYAIWGEHGAPPSGLNDGWQEKPWREAFWFYLHGPAQAGGESTARLTLWGMIETCLGEPAILLDAEGDEYQAEAVSAEEVLAFARGEHGPHPHPDPPLVDELHAALDQVGRLNIVREAEHGDAYEQIVASLEPDEIDRITHGGLSDVLYAAETRVTAALTALNLAVYGGLQGYWQDFRDFLTERWQLASAADPSGQEPPNSMNQPRR